MSIFSCITALGTGRLSPALWLRRRNGRLDRAVVPRLKLLAINEQRRGTANASLIADLKIRSDGIFVATFVDTLREGVCVECRYVVAC